MIVKEVCHQVHELHHWNPDPQITEQLSIPVENNVRKKHEKRRAKLCTTEITQNQLSCIHVINSKYLLLKSFDAKSEYVAQKTVIGSQKSNQSLVSKVWFQ